MFSFIVPVLSALIVFLLAVYSMTLRRTVLGMQRKNEVLIDSLSQEVQGISHGSMGVGRKVLVLERQIEELHACIEEIQKNDPAKVSYAEASRLVSLGAGVDDLMNTCGISRPEAELVSALTQSKEQVPILTSEA